MKPPVRSLNPNYLPSAYLFAYNCDPSWRLHISDLRPSPLSLIKGHTNLITQFYFCHPHQRLLWLFVEVLEICPSKPSMDPPVDSVTGKPVLVSSVAYKEWITEKKEYLEWLWSDSAAMGLMQGAIEFGQREHIASASSSKDLWDCLHKIHITQRQGINVHYHYQELYTKKWDEQTTMSDHIGSFLHLRCRINDSGQTLDDIHIIHAILFSLPCSSIWDIVKQNLLDKGTELT